MAWTAYPRKLKDGSEILCHTDEPLSENEVKEVVILRAGSTIFSSGSIDIAEIARSIGRSADGYGMRDSSIMALGDKLYVVSWARFSSCE